MKFNNSIILFMFLSIAILLISYNINVDIVGYDNTFFITNLLICFISLYFIFHYKDRRPFSLYKIFYLFFFFFFGIAPMIQFPQKISFFGAPPLRIDEYIQLNVIIIFILLFYNWIYKIVYMMSLTFKQKNIYKKFILSHEKISNKQILILLILSLISFFVIFYVNGFNFVSMLVRGGGDAAQSRIKLDTSSNLLIYRFVQPICMMTLLYYLISKNKKKWVVLVLLLIALITASPASMPRFSFAALYLPVFIVSFKWLRKQNLFAIIFVFGLLFVFPFMDQFRYYDASKGVVFQLNFDAFKLGHYDNYNNFALTISHNIVTYGYQLLGVLFFWIPRSAWPTKPVGSGSFLADKLDFSFNNISANYFNEGYINFGLVGVIIFLIIIAFVCSKIDKIYWSFNSNSNSFFNVIYFILLGMLFFILRGDLLSSFAYTCGFLIGSYIVFKLVTLFKKRI